MDKKITVKLKNVTVQKSLNEISKQINYYFTYDNDVPGTDRIINEHFKDISIEQCLNRIFNDTTLTYQVFENHIIIKKDQPLQIDSILNNPSIDKLTLQAKLVDADSKETLAFASVSIENENIGTITNKDGIFILKIPKKMIQKNLCISYLGYENACIPVKNLYKNFHTIQLKRTYISLQEVIIRNQDPKKIIRKALNNIAENYPQKPVYLTSFYREKVKQKSRYMFLSEAVLKIYKTAYISTLTDRIRVLKSRTFKQVAEKDSIQMKLKSGLKTALILDMVKNRRDFIQEPFLNEYHYRLSDIENYDNRASYIIDFKPRDFSEDAIYTGQLYIDADNYAIIGADYEIAADKLKKMNNRFIVKKEKGLNVKLKKAVYHVQYHFWNGKYYIEYVKAELSFKVRKKKKWFATNFTTSIEMAVSNIDTLNVHKFKRKEADKTNTVFVDDQREYDEQFWEEYNFIKPEDDWQKAIQKLQLKLNKTVSN